MLLTVALRHHTNAKTSVSTSLCKQKKHNILIGMDSQKDNSYFPDFAKKYYQLAGLLVTILNDKLQIGNS